MPGRVRAARAGWASARGATPLAWSTAPPSAATARREHPPRCRRVSPRSSRGEAERCELHRRSLRALKRRRVMRRGLAPAWQRRRHRR
eukprot:335973-Prymnesium_polylepis.1